MYSSAILLNKQIFFSSCDTVKSFFVSYLQGGGYIYLQYISEGGGGIHFIFLKGPPPFLKQTKMERRNEKKENKVRREF